MCVQSSSINDEDSIEVHLIPSKNESFATRCGSTRLFTVRMREFSLPKIVYSAEPLPYWGLIQIEMDVSVRFSIPSGLR